VIRPEDVLLGDSLPQGRVIVLDAEGLQTGVGIAELLAVNGAEVEFVSPGFSPLGPRVIATQHTHHIMTRLRAAGVTMTQTSYIRSIGDREVTLVDSYTGDERTVADVAAVVLATSRVPANALEMHLEGKVAQLFTIGDAASPRMFAAPSYEGHKFARYIGEPGAPESIGEVYFRGGFAEGPGADSWAS
jgi:dimethylamine/trimethylamine dehydrogenase